jgi:glutaredoxin
MEIIVYSKSGCPFCDKAKDWFNTHQFSYTEILMDDEEQRLAFYQKNEWCIRND